MKSPLAAIRAASEILHDEPPAEDRARFLANIDSQSARLSAMIDKVLALAAVEYRQSLDRLEQVDLPAMLARLAADLAPRLERGQLRLEVQADANLRIAGNAFLLEQAVSNLLDNAIEFSPAGSSIELCARQAEGLLRIEVRDRGPGVPDFALSRVFDRFYSLPRPEGSRSSGIGLSFVREVA
jgi:two-component system sensor histidine kinase CreC